MLQFRKVMLSTAVGLAVTLPSVAIAQETQSKLYEVLERGYLVFGTGSTNVPWHFVDDNNELAGFDRGGSGNLNR